MECKLEFVFNSCSKKTTDNICDKDIMSLVQIFIRYLDNKCRSSETCNSELENLVARYLWKLLLFENVSIIWKNNIGRALVLLSVTSETVIKVDKIFNILLLSSNPSNCQKGIESLKQIISSMDENTTGHKKDCSNELLMEVLVAFSFGILECLNSTLHATRIQDSFLNCRDSVTPSEKGDLSLFTLDNLLFSDILRHILIKYSFGFQMSFHTLPLIISCFKHIEASRIMKEGQQSDQLLRDLIDITVANWCSNEPGVPSMTVDKFLPALFEINFVDNAIYVRLCNMLNSDWPCKGSVKSIPVILKYYKLFRLLDDCPFLMEKLLKQLSVNVSTSAASNSLKSIFKCAADSSEIDSLNRIRNSMLNFLVEHRNDDNRECELIFIRSCLPSVCVDLPILVKFLLEEVLKSLAGHLKGSPRRNYLLNLWSGVTVALMSSSIELCRDDTYQSVLMECLTHADDSIRLQALSHLPHLISTEPQYFHHLLLPVLSLNFSLNSTSLRVIFMDCLSNILQKLIENILTNQQQVMTHYYSQNKSENPSPSSFLSLLPDLSESGRLLGPLSVVNEQKATLDRQFNLLIDNFELSFRLIHRLLTSDSLFPGSCYQRQKITLDILETTLDRFSGNIRSYKKAGFTKDTQTRLKLLMKLASESVGWSYGSDPHLNQWLVEAFLTCNKSLYGQLVSLIERHFTACLSPDQLTRMRDIAVQLCNSPQTDRYSAGAYLLYHLSTRYEMTDGDTSLEEYFLSKLREYLREISQQSILHMAAESTGHGFFLCLDLILSGQIGQSRDVSHLDEIFEICQQNINNMMAIMGNSINDNKAAASFEELGRSIMTAAFSETDDEEDDISQSARLPVEFQKVLSWSWHSIKLTASLLVSWSAGKVNDDRFLSVGHLLFKILTQSRHRGTIESVNSSFQKYLNILVRFGEKNPDSMNPSLRVFPEALVTQCIQIITDNSYSVTRRSAGLPYVLTSLLMATNKCRQHRNRLLDSVVRQLMNIATSKHFTEGDCFGQQDPPAVHALNLLKGLSNSMGLYLTDLIHCSLAGFSSNQWSVRNSSLQLFGSLVIRFLGPENQPSLSTMEFFSSYPGIWSQLENFLTIVCPSTSPSSRNLIQEQTCLPVLALLSRLSPYPDLSIRQESYHHVTQANSRMLSLLTGYFTSPVMTIRILAAKAMLSFLPLDCENVGDSCRYVCALLISITSGRENNLSHAVLYLARIFYVNLLQELNTGLLNHLVILPDLVRLVDYISYLVDQVSNWYLSGQVLQLIYLLVSKYSSIRQFHIQSVKEKIADLNLRSHSSSEEGLITMEYRIELHRLHYHFTEDIGPLLHTCCSAIPILIQRRDFRVEISQPLLTHFLSIEEPEIYKTLLRCFYNQIRQWDGQHDSGGTLDIDLLISCLNKIIAVYHCPVLIGGSENIVALRVATWLFAQTVTALEKMDDAESEKVFLSDWFIKSVNSLLNWMLLLCATDVETVREESLKSGKYLWMSDNLTSSQFHHYRNVIWPAFTAHTKQKFLSSMINLVLDECEEVRICAISLFHRVLSQLPTTHNAPEVPFTNQTLLLRYLADNLSIIVQSDFLPCDWLLSLWKNQERALERSLDYSVSLDYSEDLFEPEDCNVFREYRLIIEFCFVAFQSLLKKEEVCPNCKEWFDNNSIVIKLEYLPHVSETRCEFNSKNVTSINILTAAKSLAISYSLRKQLNTLSRNIGKLD